ncbi:MAG: nucleotidyltransferase domain-containing protein [Chloroflexi bacterium]|nr:nucleotidyltransferase domain-containing protein [Chloroflexota bacterium]
MTKKESLLKELKALIAPVHPVKAILFGSFAHGVEEPDSDIDLLVVLNKKGFSRTYSEMLENRRELSRRLRTLRKKTPIDLFVYTKDEWDYIKQSGSSFYEHINEHGVELL